MKKAVRKMFKMIQGFLAICIVLVTIAIALGIFFGLPVLGGFLIGNNPAHETSFAMGIGIAILGGMTWLILIGFGIDKLYKWASDE